ncbi:hypothetical protein POTOM_001409 [Populus tomentosa]|uniref:Uncharacterized protein n=1 Tax=Populus tomentosa TaxID=118781 RepID=A0A8X8DHV7_POPTO|nr:hypothetical protein POTOM_001409 [Populus tomentosa]
MAGNSLKSILVSLEPPDQYVQLVSAAHLHLEGPAATSAVLLLFKLSPQLGLHETICSRSSCTRGYSNRLA